MFASNFHQSLHDDDAQEILIQIGCERIDVDIKKDMNAIMNIRTYL